MEDVNDKYFRSENFLDYFIYCSFDNQLGSSRTFFPSFVLMIAALFAIIFESLDKSYYAKYQS